MSRLILRIQQTLKQDPVLSRVLKNTGFLFSSTTISLVLVFVQSILAARLLGVTDFGLIAIVMSVVTTVNRLFSFRMGEYVIRFFGKELHEGNLENAGGVVKTAAMLEGITSFLAFICLWLIAPLGALFIAKDPNSVSLIRLFGIAILLNFVTETATGILHSTNQFKKQAVLTLINSVITLVIIIVAYILHGSTLFVLWAYIAGKAILGLGPILLAWSGLKEILGRGWWRKKYSKPESIREMLKFAFSTNLSGTIKLLVSESEPLWLGLFLDKQAVGLYKIALSIVNPLMMPITPMIDTTFPEIARSVIQQKWHQLLSLLKRTTVISAIWTGLVTLLMVVLGKWIIRIAYTDQFVPAYTPLMILLLGFGFANIFFWNRKLLLAFGKANVPLIILAIAAVLKIGLSFWLVPAFGINAEAWLLSGNFILSVGVMVVIGLRMVRIGIKQSVTGQ